MEKSRTIPRLIPLLLADGVLLPGSSMRIPVTNPNNMNMVRDRILSSNTLSSSIIGVVLKEPGSSEKEDEGVLASKIHAIGTAAAVVQVTGTNWPKPAYSLLVTGLCRFKMEKLLQESPYLVARVTQLDKIPGEIEGHLQDASLLSDFEDAASRLVDLLDVSIPVVAKLKKMLNNFPRQHLPDIFASIVKASNAEKLKILDAINVEERFREALPLLMRQIEGLKLLKEAKRDHEKKRRNNGTFSIMVGNKKTPITVKRIPRRLSDEDDEDGSGDEIADLELKIKNGNLPKHALKAAQKELKRLQKMPSAMPEYTVTRNYLELLAELPWSKSTKDSLDIAQARRDLDADHYSLEKPKKRVIEYLAVRQLKNSLKGPILCLVGPPGVGKTSVGRSVARTLGREFHRISLGGVCDQSDIRGHRRTYIGSMPGRIIHGLKTVAVNNPVFLLDEIDKLSKSMQGDPAAALLEVLDPEQNSSFTDNYLNVPFDLSQVLFIATANTTSTIPPALLDRMEVIQIPGYTQEEKAHICSRHLLPKQLKDHGLTEEHLQLPEDTIKYIISRYTREAGVRALERRIGAVCRAVAVKVAEGKTVAGDDDHQVANTGADENGGSSGSDLPIIHPPEMPIVIDKYSLKAILGPPIYESEMSERLGQPGVATGLAWTSVGGELLFVEATKFDGDGQLILTGQLGEVMKESARLGLNWVRSNASQCGIELKEGSAELVENTDVHIHFPAGAVGKDGPSAGVAIVTVLVSLFTGRCVRSDTAMTGEITLRGLVLPVGGIKEKVLAAHRAGIKRVILPKRNEKDLEEIPKNVQNDLVFILVTHLEEALPAVFEGGFPSLKIPSTSQINSKL